MQKGEKSKEQKLDLENMKRRKIVGLVLLIGTVCYLLACLLALYQNQRVKMEKGIEEALKAYSTQEGINVKELSKDFNLMLDEKLDISDMNKQIMKYQGSFATMEKNINSITNEMIDVEYNFNHLNERIENMENFYSVFYDEVKNMNTLYEGKMIEITNHITEIRTEIEVLKKDILELENQLAVSDQKQQEDVRKLQEQITLSEQRITELEENALYFQYDSESNTLNVFGKKKEVSSEE